MSYPTDPRELALLSPDEWDALLSSPAVLRAPARREIVRLLPVLSKPVIEPNSRSAPTGRRALILSRIAAGEVKANIARDLGISPSMLSKIVKGERR